MHYWEFLLQKEGDQSWLPLESAQIEILEGRYRVVAHTDHGAAAAEIRITQLLTQCAPPRRRRLRRQGQINSDGLMVVMPYTWLEPGSWEIHCEVAGAEAQYAVELQVLTQDSPLADDLITDPWEGEAAVATAGLLSSAALESAFQAVNQALAETVGAQAPPALELGSAFRIELAQSALVARQGLTVVGQVQATSEQPLPESPVIALRLVDPQTSAVLVTGQQPVSYGPFAMPVALPEDLGTCLLLGELLLGVPQGEQVQVLAVHRFTVTADVQDLLGAIANQAEIAEEFGLSFPETPDADPIDDGPLPPPRAVPALLLPQTGRPLPPKIYYPDADSPPEQAPSLPSFGGAAPRPPTPAPAPSRSLQLPQIPSRPPTAAEQLRRSSPPPAAPAPAEEETLPLNFEERFWSRLNALAQETRQAAAPPAAPAAPADGPAPPTAAALPADEPPPAATAFAGEVVIYEEEAPPPAPAAAAAADPQEVPSPPTPEISLSPGELVAGAPLPVSLRVPIHPHRLGLRVWLSDPQTRTLADEPRQLLQLSPDGHGYWRATAQLSVPLGCLELLIEAIAIDLVTQQESYKASLRRPVVPAQLPAPREDFEV